MAQDVLDPDLEIRALGELWLGGTEGDPVEPIQPKRLALLLYLSLALPRTWHRRDSLLAIFWPELDAKRGSLALRQALHSLRRSLPDGVLCNWGVTALGLARERVRCDVVAFEAELERGCEATALRHYRGELLPGFHLSECPDFERWLEMERERLRRRAVRAALVLAHGCSANGELSDVERWTRFAVQHSLSNETVLSEGIKLLAAIGARAAAIQLGSAFVHRLQRDFEIEPSEETLQLLNQLREGPAEDSPEKPRPAASAAIQPPVRPAAARPEPPHRPVVRSATPANVKAYHAYLRGLHQDQRRTPAAMQRAIGEYHEALRLEPNFAPAHLGLGRVWSILPSHAAALAAEAYPRAKHHAAKALALDPSLGEAHAWFAMALVCYEWDWAGAEREFERAIENDPTATICRVTRALYLLAPLGRFDEAVAEVELARALEPSSLATNAYLAMTYYYVHEYEWAVREARITLELNPEFPLAWWVLGMASEQIGQCEEAVEAFQRALALTRGSPLMLAHLARVYAQMGGREHAEAILDQITGSAEVANPLAVFIAGIHAALEDSDAALDWLYRAYRARAPHLLRTNINPVFESLKNEQRFRELLLRIGLRAT